MKTPYIIDSIKTKNGIVPQVTTSLNAHDLLGTIMVRWSINRNNYKVKPGLYAIGNPDSNSDVFVTANYKLSFDHLRKNLDGINSWILVLDTKGINVWCAAGKGTFGTKELIKQITETELEKIVQHKRIIVPQLGATGVAAHEIKEKTGFRVVYGPVKASDIKDFLNARLKKSLEMRTVTFGFYGRLKLIPVDLFYGKYYLLISLAVFFILTASFKTAANSTESVYYGLSSILNIIIAYLSGLFVTPMLLPFIPSRSFALKGFFTGLALSLGLFFLHQLGNNYFEIISWFFIITSTSSFLAMNFTGSSTFTSLSGVKKEMKIAIPFQIGFAAIGLILFIISLFI
jgi:hypothetical protein